MLDRATIKNRAKEVLKQNYWLMVGALLITSAISGVCGAIPYVGGMAAIAVVPIVTIGCSYFAVLLYRGQKASIEVIFDGFKNFGHNLGGYWWMMLFTYLWTLLFVIPGIVKYYSYCMTPYILMDQPEVDAQEALKKSMRMTDGHKGEIFVMHLSFIGWMLLSGLTFGILAIFYVAPYMALTMAGYYVVLRDQEMYGNGGYAYTQNPYQQPQYQQPMQSPYPNQTVQPQYQQPMQPPYPNQTVQPQYQQPMQPPYPNQTVQPQYQQPMQPPYPDQTVQPQYQQPMQPQQPPITEQTISPDTAQQSQNPDEDNPYMTPIE